MVEQRGQPVDRRELAVGADALSRLDGEAGGEQGQSREQRLLGRRYQPNAPLDRRLQRAVTDGRVTPRRTELLARAAQAFEDRRSGQDRGARGGQLEGQRQPAEIAAELGHRGGIEFAGRERRVCGCDPLDEQCARGGPAHGVGRRVLAGIGERQWLDAVDPLERDPQPDAAGHKQLQLRASGHELPDRRAASATCSKLSSTNSSL